MNKLPKVIVFVLATGLCHNVHAKTGEKEQGVICSFKTFL